MKLSGRQGLPPGCYFFNRMQSQTILELSAQKTVCKYLDQENQGHNEGSKDAHKRKNSKGMLCRVIHQAYSDSSLNTISPSL